MTRRLGIIGAGKVGTTIGRLAVLAGWDVWVARHPGQPTQELIVSAMLPQATLADAAEVAELSDIVVLAVPLSRLDGVDVGALGGRIVVDAMNHWYPVDGNLDAIGQAPSSSAWVQSLNPAMRVVKSLNHLGYHDLETDARPHGDPERRAVAVASDDASARAAVAELVDDLGFDPVEVPMGMACALEGDGPVFGRWLDAAGLREALASAPQRVSR